MSYKICIIKIQPIIILPTTEYSERKYKYPGDRTSKNVKKYTFLATEIHSQNLWYLVCWCNISSLQIKKKNWNKYFYDKLLLTPINYRIMNFKFQNNS